MAASSQPPRVASKSNGREIAIAIAAGLSAMALILYGVSKMGSGVVGQTLTGEVIAKEFTPLPETQITLGKGGLRARESKGEYLLEIKVPNHDSHYRVWVDEQTFHRLNKGDTYSFPRPVPTVSTNPSPLSR
jgi:hypothetical protein